LPIVTFLNPLGKTALRSILTEPKNAIIKQYQQLLRLDGIELTFDEQALDFIVSKAIEYKLGARGLRGIVEAIMTDYMYSLPDTKIRKFRVTKEVAELQLNNSQLTQLRLAQA
jgi:ATP-dependent Clp protease ATP-binding subunit ClpX